MVTKKKAVAQGNTQKPAAQKKVKPTKKTAPAVEEKHACQSVPPFPIIGIGASAGGLVALEGFFKSINKDFGAAFVVVTHLDPNHTSILPELLQKKTSMKVNQVVDNMAVAPNQVFIIPPNREMAILNGTLQLLDLSMPRGSNLPIDIFLRSLAQDQGDKAVGIILSGTGTDGTLGIRAIKGEGGIVMVQDIESAKYDGMPGSAISTGLADYILAPEKMPEQLFSFLSHQSQRQASATGINDDTMQHALPKIYVLLRARTDHDFSLYKKNTVYRRIERRMHVHQIDNVGDYVRFLQESDQEITILFKELLIGVTSFFRDHEAFELLKENVLDLLKNKQADYPARIWVPGCSSGEEAYSIAILFQECMETLGRRFSVQVFATDLDEEAINRARAGIYPESIAADVNTERLNMFFTKIDNHYQIKKKIREKVIFAPQNITKDPPFTKLDLLSCRNLLIYFGPKLQKKLLPVFHYSLKTDGLLFLGSSETIGQSVDMFAPIDTKWKIFKRHSSDRATHSVLDFPTASPPVQIPEKVPMKSIKPLKAINPLKLMKTITSQSDMSTCLVIDDHGSIIYIHGRTGCFLEPAEGEADLNVLAMARPGLKAGLTTAIRKMATDRQEVFVKGLQVHNNGGYIDVNLIIKPLPDLQIGLRGLMMVIFDEVSPQHEGEKAAKLTKRKRPKKSAELVNIENELQYTRENLQTTIEELETSNEELKSTNESCRVQTRKCKALTKS